MRFKLLSWLLVLVVVIGTVTPISLAAEGGSDKTSALSNLTAVVKQNGNTITEHDKMNSKDPIEVTVSFGVPVAGDEPAPEVLIQQGDLATFELSSAFTVTSSTYIPLSFNGTPVAHVTLVNDPAGKKVTANVNFDGNAEVFDGSTGIYSVTGNFIANLQYDSSGSEGTEGDHQVTILGKTYTVTVPPVETVYMLAKKGTPDLANKAINWEVEVEATKSGNPVDLKGYRFQDQLMQAGDYVSGSFEVDSTAMIPDLTGGALSYTFPDNSLSPKTITFQTSIPNNKYYTNSAQSVSNSAQLLDKDNALIREASTTVTFTPEWIKKNGVPGGEIVGGVYDPSHRTITWTITANQMGANLDNLTITDHLPSGLSFESARWQTSIDGTAWNDAGIISAVPADDKYVFPGTANTRVRLVLTSKVDDTGPTTNVRTFNNSASLSWEGMPSGVNPSTGNIGVGIGYNAITKSGTADYSNREIRWTVNVDAKGQNIPDLKVYDLLVYGSSTSGFNINSATGIPDGIKAGDLTPRYDLKYEHNYNGDGTVNVIPILQGSERVADLLEISGLSTSETNSFSFDSRIMNPDIFAGNKTTAITNTAALFSGISKLNAATGTVNYTSKMLEKELLKRGAHSAPAAGVNSQRTTNAAEGFDYIDKTAIFRLSVNADSLDFESAQNAADQALGTATLKDTLPSGWEFVDIVPGQKYLVFEGTAGSGSSVNALDTTPDEISELTANIIGGTAAFTFQPLDKPYVILVKARPDDAAVNGYFNNNKTSTLTNALKLEAVGWSTGVSSWRNVTVKSEVLKKTYDHLPATGSLRWTVNYNPYNLNNIGDFIEDTLPIGLDLRTDSKGTLMLDNGNITIHEMTLKADGTLGMGAPVALSLGDNVSYNNTTRVLSFKIPDSSHAYRYSYLTDITGDPGSVTNQVRLTKGNVDAERQNVNYAISSADGYASMLRSGWLEITKRNGSTAAGLPGAEFTLFTEDGSTVIRKAVSGADGKLRMKVIPDGVYVLRETSAPAGYTLDNVEHKVTVETSEDKIWTSIDGKTGTGSNLLSVNNFITGIAGNLAIGKTVAGNDGDLNKKFDFTVSFDGATDNYPYTGTGGGSGGIISSGGTISLAHGEGIVITGLPKDTEYSVTEENYNAEGYLTVSTGATGTIVADDTKAAVFTNTKDKPGSLVVSKTVAGNAGDRSKKFDFTITFDGAPGIYAYTGTAGGADGTLRSGDTFSLAHGESITVTGLPKDTSYTVTEADYADQGYTTTSTGSTGVIQTDTTTTAAFVNTKNVFASPGTFGAPGSSDASDDSKGALTISKIVAGDAVEHGEQDSGENEDPTGAGAGWTEDDDDYGGGTGDVEPSDWGDAGGSGYIGEKDNANQGTPKTGDSSLKQAARIGLIFFLLALAVLFYMDSSLQRRKSLKDWM